MTHAMPQEIGVDTQWLLPSLSDILNRVAAAQGDRPVPAHQATQQWRSALGALETVLSGLWLEWGSEALGRGPFDPQKAEGQVAEREQLEGEGHGDQSRLAGQVPRGLLLCGPRLLFSPGWIGSLLASWVFSSDTLAGIHGLPLHLLLAEGLDRDETSRSPAADGSRPHLLPLLTQDPLAAETFCLVMTAELSLVMVLSPAGMGQLRFQFSFEPDVIQWCWQALVMRVRLSHGAYASQLDQLAQLFPAMPPDYRLVSRFTQVLLQRLAQPEVLAGAIASPQSPASSEAAIPCRSPKPPVSASRSLQTSDETAVSLQQSRPLSPLKSICPNGFEGAVSGEIPGERGARETSLNAPDAPGFSPVSQVHGGASGAETPETLESSGASTLDLDLLRAIAHEIRTPLTTIRTLTRLLLRRRDLAVEVIKRLEMIDHECTEQIDRFGLIYRAAELETEPPNQPRALATLPLEQIFTDGMPRWLAQARRRNLSFALCLPPELPMVVSDPTMLDQALTGLIDRFTRHLPGGSHIQLLVSLAGSQLKLQFRSDPPPMAVGVEGDGSTAPTGWIPQFKAIGQLLTFQPETGSVSLNLNATKNLFQAMGGRLLVRQRSQQGQVFTIFLPLETTPKS